MNFGEAVNTLEDYHFFEDITTGVIKLSNEVDQIQLEKFVQSLMAYEEPLQNYKEILYDREWKSITEQAGEIRKVLEKRDW